MTGVLRKREEETWRQKHTQREDDVKNDTQGECYVRVEAETGRSDPSTGQGMLRIAGKTRS